MTCAKTIVLWTFVLIFLFLNITSVNADVFINTPSAGARLYGLNTTLNITTNESMTGCEYSINDYVEETCVFNSTTNITAEFGWNRLEVCGINGSASEECESINFWADKISKDTADYFVLFILLILGFVLGIGGFVKYGYLGVMGGILLFVAAIESISLGLNPLSYTLMGLSLLVIVGCVVR